MAFEPVAGTYLNYDENKCDRNLICLALMENLDKNASVQISWLFWTHEHVYSQRVFRNTRFQPFK